MDKLFIEVKNGNDGFKIVDEIARTVRNHAGWQSVTYKGRRYQLFGGIRNAHFIDIANPLKRR